jgi:hypothetical protein
MKQRTINDPRIVTYNKAVKAAYSKILKATQNLLATIERHDLRCAIHLSEKTFYANMKEHQLISPVIYLALHTDDDGDRYCIQFGFEQFSERNAYTPLTAKFMRLLHRYTAKEHTEVNIEDCIYSAYITTACSELFEAVEGSPINYPIKVIPYKPQAVKRKQMQAVA